MEKVKKGGEIAKEVRSLVEILKEEYGIEPAEPLIIEEQPRPAGERQQQAVPTLHRKQNRYVPKKLGKVNNRSKKR